MTASVMVDDAKLNELQKEVERLNGEVMRLSAEQAKLEGRLMAISQMLEERGQHKP